MISKTANHLTTPLQIYLHYGEAEAEVRACQHSEVAANTKTISIEDFNTDLTGKCCLHAKISTC